MYQKKKKLVSAGLRDTIERVRIRAWLAVREVKMSIIIIVAYCGIKNHQK